MNASEPPSSSTVFLMCLPAIEATALPAPSLPVSVTAATRGSATIASMSLPATRSVSSTPAGAPHALKMRAISSAQPVTLAACLSSATLPAIKPGAAKRKTCQNGKFQGMIASTTPKGLNET
jgi:hypothetical protein